LAGIKDIAAFARLWRFAKAAIRNLQNANASARKLK
jgi:hypothetical protein